MGMKGGSDVIQGFRMLSNRNLPELSGVGLVLLVVLVLLEYYF